MFVPVVFMVVMVVHASHSLKAELVNGTATITIEDFDKACESAIIMRPGDPTKMDGLKHEISIEEDPSRDVESLLRSVLEILCPYVGYFPVMNVTAEKDELKSDETTKTTILSTAYSDTSNATEKNKYILTNSTDPTLVTESIPTNKSSKIITDIKLDSYKSHENVTDSILGIEIESTLSTRKDEYHSAVDDKPKTATENTTTTILHKTEKNVQNTTTTKLDKPEIVSILKSTKSDVDYKMEVITETTLADSSIKDITYNSSADDTPRNSTLSDTLILGDLIEEVSSTKSISSSPVTPKLNNESTIPTTKVEEKTSIKENTTNTTPFGVITNKDDLFKNKINTNDNETDSTSTIHSTKKTSKVNVTTISYSKTTEKGFVDKKDSESKNSAEVTKLPTTMLVPAFVKDGNISDYSSEEDTIDSSTSYYNKHTNDDLIVVYMDTKSTTAKYKEEPVLTTNNGKTDNYNYYYEDIYDYYKEIFEHKPEESTKEIEETHETTTIVEEETKSEAHETKNNNKVIYEHDTNAVDDRRKIVVILFVSILLALSLIWAVKFLYKRHKGSYVLPQEGDNDMELGGNSTENKTK